MRKIDTEEFVFSPSARNGAVTEGDADCRDVLSVSYPWTAMLTPSDGVISECERVAERNLLRLQ